MKTEDFSSRLVFCKISDIESVFLSDTKLVNDAFLWAYDYKSEIGLYELSGNILKIDFSYIVASNNLKDMLIHAKRNKPLAIALVREEMLVDEYLEIKSFERGYEKELEFFINNEFSSSYEMCLSNSGELIKGKKYWLYYDEEEKVFWMSDDYYLYEDEEKIFNVQL